MSASTGNQLPGCAVLEMKLTNTKVVGGNDDKQNKTNDNQELAPELKRKRKNQRSGISIYGNIVICLLLMILNGTFIFLC